MKKKTISGLNVTTKSWLLAAMLGLSTSLVSTGSADAACEVNFDGEKLEIKCDDAGDLVLVKEEGGDLVVGIENLGSAAGLKHIEIKTGGGADAVILQAGIWSLNALRLLQLIQRQ